MGFSRTWLRAFYGAAGAAVVVPVGLVLSIALTATVGGGGGLDGLRQLMGGPTLPASDPVARALAPSGPRSPGGVPAVPQVLPAAARAADRASAPGSGTRRSATPKARRRRSATTPSRPVTRRPVTSNPTPTVVPPQQPPPTTPPPREPDPVGDVVRGVGETADSVVRPLPVVGPPVADAVGTVIDLVAPPEPKQVAIVPVGE